MEKHDIINNAGIRIEICCWNSNCKHYWEDMCLKEWKSNEIMFHGYNGECRSFELGKNKAYELEKEMEEE